LDSQLFTEVGSPFGWFPLDGQQGKRHISDIVIRIAEMTLGQRTVPQHVIDERAD